MHKTLINFDFHPKIFTNGVNLYRESEVYRYAKEIGFSNEYRNKQIKRFLKIKILRKGA